MEQKIRKKDEREIRYVSMQRHKRKYECCLAEFEVLLSVKTWTFYYNPRLVVQIPFPVWLLKFYSHYQIQQKTDNWEMIVCL